MSELKTHNTKYEQVLDEVYLKSEADKVIAEKDVQIASLNGEIVKIQGKMCEDVFEGIMPSEHIVCIPLQEAAQRIAELKESIAVYQRNEKIDIRELRHHKYKRCLAMAKLCAWEQRFWGDGIPAYERQFQWENRAAKWKKRWLEIAEQFKEV